ncbi:MAG: aminoglycoside phosphotransferase family protein [Desulforhopalus sp.]
MGDEVVPDIVLAAFCSDPAACKVTSLGHGNINDTYLVRSTETSFVLQRINSDVFSNPLVVIENFQRITGHLTHKQDSAGRQLQTASPVLTLNRSLFFQDGHGAFWRGQSYLPHKSYQTLTSSGQAHQVGEVLAVFHRLLSDLDVQDFANPLPDFHNLPCYLERYDQEIHLRKVAMSEGTRCCLNAIDRYRPKAATLLNAERAGILSVQPIHGDPKVDNFLFSEQGEAIGLLDLDTVAMGLVHCDLGDCLRSCCNTKGEKGCDGSPVIFDMDICSALLGGYFSKPNTLLSEEERAYIFDAVLLICFELGVRFFTDHLRGNLYFKVVQDGDNLLRAVNQFRLADVIEEREQEIRAMVVSSGVE